MAIRPASPPGHAAHAGPQALTVSLSNHATRLVENGVDLRTLPILLGSRRISAR
jgi:site-specific recombinase XerD